ncbi:MAG: plasmid stabilization protein [Nitrospirae bacterium RBG_16_64_22]|nr:MAG: plasmid stabilization protein [Nitrospirae bacterium RBG_16_64_22]
MIWRVELTRTAARMLGAIRDRRIREKIAERIDGLAKDPDKQGKPLMGELTGYRSLRAAGQRYRIIYRIEKDKVVILIAAVGIRKEGSQVDIYALAKKLLRMRLVEPD